MEIWLTRKPWRVVLLLLVFLLLDQPCAIKAQQQQRNAFLSLWGNVFEELPDSVVESVTESGMQGGEESRGKLSSYLSQLLQQHRSREKERRQRYEGMMNILKESLHGLQRLYSGPQGEGFSPFGLGSADKMNSTTNTSVASSESMWSNYVAQTLKNISTYQAFDASKLVSLTILQNLILKHLTQKQQQDETMMGAVPTTKGVRMGVIIPPSIASSHFVPSSCLRMENFGNGEGYFGAWIGVGPKCDVKNRLSDTGMKWRQDGAFAVDCTMDQSAPIDPNVPDVQSPMVNNTIHYSGYTRFGGLPKPPLTLFSRTNKCVVSLSSQDPKNPQLSSGAMMTMTSVEGALSSFKANTLLLRACNRHHLGGRNATAASRVMLESLKLNGKPLAIHMLKTPVSGSVEQQHDPCTTVVLRVPTRAVADSFVLTGRLVLTGQEMLLGEEGFVDIQFGDLRLF